MPSSPLKKKAQTSTITSLNRRKINVFYTRHEEAGTRRAITTPLFSSSLLAFPPSLFFFCVFFSFSPLPRFYFALLLLSFPFYSFSYILFFFLPYPTFLYFSCFLLYSVHLFVLLLVAFLICFYIFSSILLFFLFVFYIFSSVLLVSFSQNHSSFSIAFSFTYSITRLFSTLSPLPYNLSFPSITSPNPFLFSLLPPALPSPLHYLIPSLLNSPLSLPIHLNPLYLPFLFPHSTSLIHLAYLIILLFLPFSFIYFTPFSFIFSFPIHFTYSSPSLLYFLPFLVSPSSSSFYFF